MPANYHRTYGLSAVTTATVTVEEGLHLGMPILMNRAAGIVATLPPATGSGNEYEFIGAVDASGDQVIEVANAADTMAGFAFLGNDSAGASCFYTGATSDTITLDGTTKGGYQGWRVVVTDIAANKWAVTVMSEASGTEATPFSADVA